MTLPHSGYLSDPAQLRRLGALKHKLLQEAERCRSQALRCRVSDNTTDGETFGKRWDALAVEAEKDAELIQTIIDKSKSAIEPAGE